MRIVSGEWRGARLVAPRGRTHRPTLERVREAIFSSLADRVRGTVAVDLFAGSGALGLEALSRGARRAVFVEQAREALAALRRNISALDAEERTQIIGADVFAFLRGQRGPVADVGLVLADPPYGELEEDSAARIATAAALEWGARGLIVLEGAVGDPEVATVPGWRRWPARVYGDTRVTIDEREGDDQAG